MSRRRVAEIDSIRGEVEHETALAQHALAELRYKFDELRCRLDELKAEQDTQAAQHRARDAERDERAREYELAAPTLYALDNLLFLALDKATRAALSALGMRNFAAVRYTRHTRRSEISEALQDLDDTQVQLALERDQAGLEQGELEFESKLEPEAEPKLEMQVTKIRILAPTAREAAAYTAYARPEIAPHHVLLAALEHRIESVHPISPFFRWSYDEWSSTCACSLDDYARGSCYRYHPITSRIKPPPTSAAFHAYATALVPPVPADMRARLAEGWYFEEFTRKKAPLFDP
ncbi:hypothetical protein C8J57DRAFT_1562239 [Mycena rebaudengoi]|nr:hypothetical protein C8J57DRAFT_1562239 [Mycena rebaudengoi]